MRLLRVWLVIVLLGFMGFLSSCDSKRVFEEYVPIEQHRWDRKHTVRFDVNISDTIISYNLYLNLRNTGRYPKANLYVFTHITKPNGTVESDTINCVLADETGRWLGSGLGDVFDSQHIFKSGVQFQHSGTYTFELEQGMRIRSLEGVRDVGIRIEKTE